MSESDVSDIEVKFLKAILSSKRAFAVSQGALNGYDFSKPCLTWGWTKANEYKEETGHSPKIEYFKAVRKYLEPEEAMLANALLDLLDENDTDLEDLQFYIDELIKRKRLQAQIEGITAAKKALRKGDADESARILQAAAVAAPGIKPRTQAGLRLHRDRTSPILYPTGLSSLDYHIGGLGAGQLGLFMGVYGVGKSIVANNFGFGALRFRYCIGGEKVRIWHIDTENGEDIVTNRYVAMMAGVNVKRLNRNALTSDEIDRVESWYKRNKKRLEEQLFIYPAEYLSVTPADIERELVMLEAADKKPHVILFDSPDHMLMKERPGRARWEKFLDIYDNMKRIADVHQVAIWCFTWADIKYEKKTAGMGAGSDAKGKSKPAHVMVSLNIDPTDEKRRFLWIGKHRTDACRYKIDLEIDWDHGRMFAPLIPSGSF